MTICKVVIFVFSPCVKVNVLNTHRWLRTLLVAVYEDCPLSGRHGKARFGVAELDDVAVLAADGPTQGGVGGEVNLGDADLSNLYIERETGLPGCREII